VEGLQQGADGRLQGLSAFDVQGALLELLPKHCSHVACGHLDSICDHLVFMIPCKLTRLVPLGGLAAGDEGSADEVFLLLR
jgi:hypothetical protein